MNSQSKVNAFQYLGSICNHSSSVQTKLFAITLQQKPLKMFEISLMIIEYLQLVSQALLLAPSLSEDSYFEANPTFKTLISVAKLFDLGYWLYSEKHKTLTMLILTFSAILTLSKYLLYLYAFLFASQRVKGRGSIISLWRLLVKTQARILCYFTCTLWVRVILTTVQEDAGILGANKNSVIVFAGLMIALEYAFSYFLQTCYCYMLPTKSFLSSRHNYLEVITLTQKFITQLLQIILPGDFIAASWIFASVNIFVSLVRMLNYFTTLPPYNFSALIFQGNLLVLVFSLDLACFIENILHTFENESKMSFLILAWTLLALLTIRITTEYFKKLQLSLVDPQKKNELNLLIHRVKALLELPKLNKELSKKTRRFSFSFLSLKSISANIESFLSMKPELKKEEENIDMSSKESLGRAISDYLEDLCLKYPKNYYIKLYTAYFYTTKYEMLGSAVKIASGLQKSGSFRTFLNASLLLCDMEARIEKEYKDLKGALDVYKYIKSRSQVAQLEKQVLDQIEVQEKVYLEVLSDTPDLAKIFDCSQIIHKQKQGFLAKTKVIFDTIPEYYLRPLVICAFYHSVLTFSVEDSIYYQRKCAQTRQKFKRFYDRETLSEENMFQDSNIFCILSAKKHESGKIYYMSKSVQDIYGKDAQFFIGKNGGRMASPSLQDLYIKFFESLEIRGPQSLQGIITRDFGYHVDGYLLPLDLCFLLHPFTTQGIYLDCICRLSPVEKDFMLILENGDIEGATFKLAKRLGLLRSQRNGTLNLVNIKDISHDLSEMNDAFNLINRLNQSRSQDKEAPIDLDFQAAEDISKAYSNEGKTVSLHPAHKLYEVTYSYHCTVLNRFFGSVCLKQVTFEEIRTCSQGSLEEHSKDPVEQLLFNVKEGKNDIGPFESENHDDDFEEVNSNLPRKLSSKIQPEILDENPYSSFAQKDLISTSRAQLIPEQRSNHFLNKVAIPRQGLVEFGDEKENQKVIAHTKAELVHQESTVASVTSKRIRHEKVSKAFKLALESRHFPMFFKFITIIFYLLVIAIFVTQLVFKVSVDTAIDNLKMGKGILDLATQRRYCLTNIHVFVRISWDIITQRLMPADFGKYYPAFSQSPANIQYYSALLSKANMNFLSNADFLDHDIQQILFAKDVELIDKDSIIYLDTFQSVDRIVETSLHASNLLKNNNSETAEKDIDFLLNNLLNDVYIKNNNIVVSLLGFFGTERDGINSTITIAIVIICLLTGGILMTLSIITWRKYLEEKQNMSAVSKINAKGIRTVLNRITSFKMAIENESSLDENRLNTEMPGRKIFENVISDSTKTDNYKILNGKGILRKYLLYIGRVWAFTLLIAGITIANSMIGKHSLDFFGKKNDQINLMSKIKSTASALGAAQYEIFGSNGSISIYNLPSPDYMRMAATNLDGFKNQLASSFMKEDFTYDPIIEEVLFFNACPRLASASLQAICNEMKLQEAKVSLVYVITTYVNIMTDQLEKFEKSNKTTESLVSLETRRIVDITSQFMLLTSMCDAISSFLNKEFEAEMTHTTQLRQSAFIILLIMLVIISFLVWICVLRTLVDYSQDFKKVLGVFKLSQVLSNFMLKLYLMKTSNGALNSIKNEFD